MQNNLFDIDRRLNNKFHLLIFFGILISVLLFLPIQTVSSQSSGHIYYVSPSGNDGSVGSLSQPWKTIGKAASVAISGDVVYIRGGVYYEWIEFSRSGTSTLPITFTNYPGEVPIIDGNNHTIPGVEYGPLLKVSGSYITISGLEVRYSRGMGVVLIGEHNVADQINSHHNKQNGILITGDYGIVQNSKVWNNCLSNIGGTAGFWASGLSAARDPNYAVIRRNEIYENWGEGLSTFEANGTLIEDNVIHDNYSANLYISDATNITVQRNFVYVSGTMIGSNQSGIMLGDETYNPASANITIINNIVYGTHGNFHWWQGIQGGGMNNVLIAHNTFVNGTGNVNNGEGGVIISGGNHVNVRFFNNLVQQDGVLPVIATGYLAGVTYTNNLWSKPPVAAASSPGDIVGDPKLSKTGSPYSPDWFLLTSSSPAIDKGTQIPAVTNDFFKGLRGNYLDIGAHEAIPLILNEKIFIPMIKK